mmetsp:Transcript_31329/g.48030  ORF Transcript_31329/g.48030 Transcript_31329/m.48030 type:complete len:558 (-) Transcript_31329:138-1811(-)
MIHLKHYQPMLLIMLLSMMKAPTTSAFSSRAQLPSFRRYAGELNPEILIGTRANTVATQSSFAKEEISISKNRKNRQVEKSSSELSAIAIDEESASFLQNGRKTTSSTTSLIPPVLSAALLITGNTVGASCLVLPETAAPLGMAAASSIFMLAFVMHLMSGLVIAEVAIKQHEELGTDVPSSFKAFADENLDSKIAANGVSAVSIFVNFCVLAFDLTRAGTVGSSLVHVDRLLPSVSTTEASIAFATIIASLVVTLSSEKLATVASCAVTVLFCSFAGLLLPGLASVHDPIGTFMTVPSSTDDLFGAMIRASPIIVQAAVYQNIIPSVTKILNYDRKKCISAIFLGSLLPTLMFMSWCFTSLSGGSDGSSMSAMTSSPFFTSFSIAALCGSSLGCIMSISEELEQWSKTLFPLKDTTPEEQQQQDDVLVIEMFSSSSGTLKDAEIVDTSAPSSTSSGKLSLESVMLATSMPLLAGILFSSGGREDIASAFLACAGGYGTPLLYGAVPVVMALQQRKRFPSVQNLIPTTSLGMIGTGSFAFVLQEISKDWPSFADGFM